MLWDLTARTPGSSGVDGSLEQGTEIDLLAEAVYRPDYRSIVITVSTPWNEGGNIAKPWGALSAVIWSRPETLRDRFQQYVIPTETGYFWSFVI